MFDLETNAADTPFGIADNIQNRMISHDFAAAVPIHCLHVSPQQFKLFVRCYCEFAHVKLCRFIIFDQEITDMQQFFVRFRFPMSYDRLSIVSFSTPDKKKIKFMIEESSKRFVLSSVDRAHRYYRNSSA